MEFTPQITVAFSGNRHITPPQNLIIKDLEGDVRSILSEIIAQCYAEGKRVFLSGGAVGFDLIAAEEVIRFRASHHNVQLIFIVPFEGQEAKYSEREKEHYIDLISQSNQVVTISTEYNISAYHLRNDYLIEHSSQLIAYNNRKGRGTASTVKRAAKRGVEIINIYDILAETNNEKQLVFNF